MCGLQIEKAAADEMGTRSRISSKISIGISSILDNFRAFLTVHNRLFHRQLSNTVRLRAGGILREIMTSRRSNSDFRKGISNWIASIKYSYRGECTKWSRNWQIQEVLSYIGCDFVLILVENFKKACNELTLSLEVSRIGISINLNNDEWLLSDLLWRLKHLQSCTMKCG